MGIWLMVKYLFITSSEAVVPALRALAKAAAGLWANCGPCACRPFCGLPSVRPAFGTEPGFWLAAMRLSPLNKHLLVKHNIGTSAD